ncbi:putative choline ethanolamine kinase [Trypanosoma theileri]|uniref:Putative choline ethanolamine kinase n=1 Tax=Trypanosoma theileri TaxID=67003 RepID=A0A1X0NH78_9TRYP|nr:putative choline ethanolamine kinase [Trypanosoma theileri]ORC84132.1 putative choline ethanolamine kinase [Trypanosoma theileri]
MTPGVQYPLGELPLRAAIRRSSKTPPCSPMKECATDIQSVPTQTSPALTWVSAESLDSIITLANRTEEQVELDGLIYRLCRSLYRVATRKSAEIHAKSADGTSAMVDGDGGKFCNMRGHEDWCPLRHLFDPKNYYKAMGTSNPHVGCTCLEDSRGALNDPMGVSQWLADELSVTRLSGGNSNHVYRLGHASFPGKTILLRVYGDGGGEVIDRARDTKAMRLMSKAELSPAVLHSFHWGRVEEFMDGIYTCTTEMLLRSPALLADIYEGLCRMHGLDAAPFLPENMNKDRFPGAEKNQYGDDNKLVSALEGRQGYYSTMLREKTLESVCPTSFERVSFRLLRLMYPHVVEEHRQSLVDWLTGEIMFVREELQRLDIPIVFSHNDLNPGNILLSRRKVPGGMLENDGLMSSDDEVTDEVAAESTALSTRYLTRKGKSKNLVERNGYLFIDFEYADANYRCVDLGNTLCELDYDYTRGTEVGGRGFIKYLFVFPPAAKAEAWRGLGEEYPRMPELIHDAWLRGTADKNDKNNNNDEEEDATDIGAAALLAVRRYFATRDGVPVSDVSLSKAQLGELLLGMLAAHLYWTLWSIVMGCVPNECTTDVEAFAVGGSGLDYMRYGDCRLREYIALRHWLSCNGFI